MYSIYQLGTPLYVPATHPALLELMNGSRYPQLRSLIICTEDAVAPAALTTGLHNLTQCLLHTTTHTELLRFVRVRNPAILAELLTQPGVDKLTGFVLPKCDLTNIAQYLELLAGTDFYYMPILETAAVFDAGQMGALRDYLLAHPQRSQLLALRIGGNDLLALLGIRRPPDRTIYHTPLAHTLAQLVTIFKPHGFHLTAPVFEHIALTDLLCEEVRADRAYGLDSKAAIHPSQIALISAGYHVTAMELDAAQRILNSDHAVFKFAGSMCETTTHDAWARQVIARAALNATPQSPAMRMQPIELHPWQ